MWPTEDAGSLPFEKRPRPLFSRGLILTGAKPTMLAQTCSGWWRQPAPIGRLLFLGFGFGAENAQRVSRRSRSPSTPCSGLVWSDFYNPPLLTFKSPAMDIIKDGWFTETCTLWPGQAMSLQVEEVLYHKKSKFQDVMVFKRWVVVQSGLN